jgi:hypothetical protein
MKISIDGHMYELFQGATTKDLLLSHSKKLYKEAQAGRIQVVDEHGNELSLDGSITGFEALFTKKQERDK